MRVKVIKISLIALSLISLLSACSSKSTISQQYSTVQRGNIETTVSTDGNLEMPMEYDLKFGAAGKVQQVLVKEGDYVRQGALLAMLDPSSQINEIKQALFATQNAQNNETAVCGSDHLPLNYADLSIARMAQQAETDMGKASTYFKQADYKDAGYWLIITYFDIQICEDLIKTRPDAASLAGAKSNSIYSPDTDAGSNVPLSPQYQQVVDYLQKYSQRLIAVNNDFNTGDYEKIAVEMDSVAQDVLTASSQAKSAMAAHSRMTYEIADTATSESFLQSSLRSTQDLQTYLEGDNCSAVESAKQLYTCSLNLQVAKDVLLTQTRIVEGMSWQDDQKYNITLEAAEIQLYQAKQDIMQTAIIAPADGDITAVNITVSNVTSSQNYSSSTAIVLIDTSDVRFTGNVDEVDIMRVKAGQAATIAVDVLDKKQLTGKVSFISPYGIKSGNIVKFNILIELDPIDNVSLMGGLSATASITTASAKDVLLVPLSVITKTSSGPIVMVLNTKTGQSEVRSITVGVQDSEYAEVLSGLQEGDKVTVYVQTPSSKSSASTSGQRPGGPGLIPGL